MEKELHGSSSDTGPVVEQLNNRNGSCITDDEILILGQRLGIVGTSPIIVDLLNAIVKIADSDSNVLITGESGTGKELVAKAVHQLSARKLGPLVPVNCGAIPGELLESELFGHVKGAFTGAINNRPGRFEIAQGGSIFLDEIGEMPPLLQVKLLRVLQEKTFEPVGAVKTLLSDARVIAATNKDLELEVKNKMFREDLFYRLNVIPIHMPSLRERRSDIPLLVANFLLRFNNEKKRSVRITRPEVLDLFMRYDWPGNVRELENLVERLVVFCGEGEVELKDLPSKLFERVELANSSPGAQGRLGFATRTYYQASITERNEQFIFEDFTMPKLVLPDSGVDLKELVSRFENDLLMQALARTKGNKNKASELLKMNRTTLVEKLKKRNIETLS